MRRAVFFDRDGIVNELVDRGPDFTVQGRKIRLTAPWTMEELHINPHIRQVIETVRTRGYLAIMATNQPDVRYGMLTEEMFQQIQNKICEIPFDDVRACRHGRHDGCECRKPKPGLLLRAAKDWNIDLTTSYFIGDNDTDMIAAQEAGCRGVLVRYPYNEHVKKGRIISCVSELPALLR